MKRTPLKRSPFLRKPSWKKLERQSKNPERRARNVIPARVRKQVHERSGGICEFVDKHGNRCTFWGTCLHHRKKRSQGGKHTAENLADSCWYHNDWAEREKVEAVKLGWTIL